MHPNHGTTEHGTTEHDINSHKAQSCTTTRNALTSAIYGKSKSITGEISKIIDLNVESGTVVIEGEVISKEARDLKTGKVLISINVFDGTSTITSKIFAKDQASSKEILDKINKARGVRISGDAQFDPFSKELGIMCKAIAETAGTNKEKRIDNAENKRVELHLHTQMSQMDGISSATNLIKTAADWGMKAIAITDHGVAQAFPEANKAAKDLDIKVIYGVEAYIVPDKSSILFGHSQKSLDTEYCVLDIETTGLSYRTEKITEIAAVKIKDGKIIDEFTCFVNPERPIPTRITEITNITDDMVKNAETIEQIIPKFLDFIGETTLVAHNANFDLGFLRYNAEKIGLSINNTYVDTVALAKGLFPNFPKYKLGVIAENLKIQVEVAHRALDDVMTLIKIFNIMLEKLKEKEVLRVSEIEETLDKNIDFKKMEMYHAVIIAKTQEGLKNLYKLISFSHLNYFYKKPRIPKSLYMKYSEGLIISSGCDRGELYSAILQGKTDEEIEEIARFYDYLEIQPIGNNKHLINSNVVADVEALKNINKKIIETGESLDKLVVATGDVHFLNPEDEIYRRIIQLGQGYKDADEQAPLYFRTTEEMLEEFSYLGEKKAYEVVVENTNKIADLCEKISPISKEKCPPEIPGSEIEIRNISEEKAKELYGDVLPTIVKERVEKELKSIIDNGFAVMYMIAQKLVHKSNEDGYLVGSRGSVGSSFVAYLLGVTEINSLLPHYRCDNCKYSDFTDYGIKCGVDLPDKNCPECGTLLKKDGIDIPFETFLGFDGDKEPDIDLNFSGEYQAKAHRYVDELFKDGSTYKAGTIGTIADKTAFGYVKKYFEEKHIPVTNAEIARLSAGCTGIKRTTGQHPGGIIVVPAGREIYEFCPVQHPADDAKSNIITTHFDYHSIDANLLKLDILGHDDPTMIKMLYDLTGIDPQKVLLDEPKTMSIFSGTEALGVTPEQINSKVGTYGVPEFGTKFVRGMLVDTKPKTFDELIRISGLSHGTDVWLGNAQTLILDGTATLDEAICTRDEIMTYLIKQGLPTKSAFVIMEAVRKGKGLKPEWEEEMKEYNVPNWYIDSCKKIKYMFPKAHAAAYVTMAYRIAWFKVHQPKAYYTAYFSIRADEFDSDVMIYGKEKVKNKMREIEMQGNFASAKDKNMYSILEVVLEMYERGIKFLPMDLYKSHSTKFIMEEEGIRPPLNSIPGLGGVAAEKIHTSTKEGKFMSIDDLKVKSGIGKSIIEMLNRFDCLKGLPESNQLSLFTM
ncbi:MAG: PolC-type DNA polymerase III [Oscillospiraceae bacterium]|nr:PolC-type DNA polymerase III [Oscillospiraceae bacterium]